MSENEGTEKAVVRIRLLVAFQCGIYDEWRDGVAEGLWDGYKGSISSGGRKLFMTVI